MALTPKIELRQSQTLVMTPQLQQAIKLLQLSNVELSTFLEEELERGDVDDNLLKQLGWTEDDLKKFAQRMNGNLRPNFETDKPKDHLKRRQFDEMLRSLDLNSRATQRRGESDRESTMENIGARRSNVPARYRKSSEKYRRSLLKPKPRK